MTAQSREAKLNSLLAESGQLFERLRGVVPDLQSAAASSLPQESKRLAATAGLLLLRNLDEVKQIFRGVTLGDALQEISPSALHLYRETLVPKQQAIEAIVTALLDVEIDLTKIPPDERNTPVLNVLLSGLDFWKLDSSGTYTDAELQVVDDLVYSPFFEPDQWLRNAEAIGPVLGPKASIRVPGNVRVRLREVSRSFILGNYLAAIALSRAILEYSLIERAFTVGIDPRDPDKPGRNKRLAWLVEDAAERQPHLRPPMESIVAAANQTLHPKKGDNLVLLPTALRNYALTSVHAARTIVEALYTMS